MSNSNQRTIIVKRTTDAVRKDYFKISNENFREAMYNLKGNAFKLYCYLCDNANGWEFDLYPCDFIRVANVSKDTYYSAFKELVKLGYLKESKIRKNVFQFVEKGENAVKVPEWQDKIQVLEEDEFETVSKEEFP